MDAPRDDIDEEPPSTVNLRVSSAAATMLHTHVELELGKTPEDMSQIWIARWGTYGSPGPDLGTDESDAVVGRVRVKTLEMYQQWPVPLTVEIDALTHRALRSRASRERVHIDYLASAIVNEHGEHEADNLRRREEGRAFYIEGRKPCWCGDGPRGLRDRTTT